METRDPLEAERRARLAAERLLEQTKSELYGANAELAKRTRVLSRQIAEERTEIEQARSQTAELRHRVHDAERSLRQAESAVTIAERRLWDSLETIRDGFAVYDPDLTLIAANRAFLGLFDGLEMVRPGILMDDIWSLMAEEGIVDTEGETPSEWTARMQARVRGTRIPNMRLKLWNGQYIMFIDRHTRDGDIVTLALNITEQTRREEQLRDARVKAEAANRAKSAFLANMSHEIRTPMNGVVGMAELLAETELSDEQRGYVEIMRSSGEALLVIINDVLDYSKIEAEKIVLKSQEFDFERSIHEVVTLLQPAAKDKGLQLAVDYDLFLPTAFSGDAGRVRQILTNLVGNAVKFTETGHVAVRVVGLPEEAEGRWRVHITVEDTGIGIPEDKIDHVFGEFSQVESEMDRSHDGTGLGLAITSRLVGLMDGEIWVESTPGEGSCFGVSLPLPSPEDAEDDHIAAPPWLKGALVLDAEGPNRAIVARQLGLMGLTTRIVDAPGGLDGDPPGGTEAVFIGPGAGGADIAAVAAEIRTRHAPAGIFLLVDGPVSLPEDAAAFDAVLPRPVLRADMLRALAALEPPGAMTMPSARADAGEGPAGPACESPAAAARSDAAAPEAHLADEQPVAESGFASRAVASTAVAGGTAIDTVRDDAEAPAAATEDRGRGQRPETAQEDPCTASVVPPAEGRDDSDPPADPDAEKAGLAAEASETGPVGTLAIAEPVAEGAEDTDAPDGRAVGEAGPDDAPAPAADAFETASEVSDAAERPAENAVARKTGRDGAMPVADPRGAGPGETAASGSEREDRDATDLPPGRTSATPVASAGADSADDLRPPDAPPPTIRRMRVLAAEDNRTNRFVFEKMVRELRIDLVFAENGEEAVRLFRRDRPDIVFTDISMPKMDGKEAAREMRRIEAETGRRRCPIVAITAHAMEGDAEDILAAGIDHYIAKPLKKMALHEQIVAAQPLGAVPVLPLPGDEARPNRNSSAA